MMETFFFGIFLCVVAFSGHRAVAEEAHHWRYLGEYGVDSWSDAFAICDAKTHDRQSPVEIIQDETLYDKSLDPITLNVKLLPGSARNAVLLTNNGHTVNLGYNNLTVVRVSGGHLEGSFRVAGVHFHWGSNNSVGSEHRVDGRQYAMEMHVVTYDESRFSDLNKATDNINSIAVLGVLFTLSDEDNKEFDGMISRFDNIVIEGTNVTMPYFNLSALLPANTGRYYRYLGSLTTPPCAESVVWTVFNTTQTISSRQLDEFRKLHEMIEPDNVTIDFLINNWRPIQPLHGRAVRSSFSANNLRWSSSLAAPLLSLTSLVVGLAVVHVVSIMLSPTMMLKGGLRSGTV